MKRARVRKGCEEQLEVRCRLVAQVLGSGEWLDELFAGTTSLIAMKLLLADAAEKDCP